MSRDLEQRIRDSLARRTVDDHSVDLDAALRTLLQSVQLSSSDTGGAIVFSGRDPIIASPLPLATMAGVALMGKAVAVAGLWRARTGEGQDLRVDLRQVLHRVSPFYDRKWELLNGFPPGMNSDPDSPFMPSHFYECRDGRHVHLLNITPRLTRRALAFLDCAYSEEAIARAVRKWDALALETAANEAGVQATMVRTVEEFLATEQFKHLAREPLIEVTRVGDSAPEPFAADPTAPLEGIRALGRGHIVAGAGLGRALAYHGADVLNIWRPGEFEPDLLYYTANIGCRSSLIDLDSASGREKMTTLVRGADVFYSNRRPGNLARAGLDPASLVKVRPGLIHVEMSLYGFSGPWANRIGFDQNAGSATGILALEGSIEAPRLPEIFIVNDYAMSWLGCIGVIAALRRRAVEGGSYRVRLSLSRVSLWLLELGLFDKEFAKRIAGTSGGHEYLAPELFTAETPCGKYQGVTDQVFMSATPGRFRFPAVPRGSSDPAWLDRTCL